MTKNIMRDGVRSDDAGQQAPASSAVADSKHTPGPWEVVRHNHVDGDLWLSVNHTNDGVMKPWIAEIKYLTTGEGEQWANARLIAAAPDLLAALKAMVASYDGIRDGLTSRIVKAKLASADAAIAKAEGR